RRRRTGASWARPSASCSSAPATPYPTSRTAPGSAACPATPGPTPRRDTASVARQMRWAPGLRYSFARSGGSGSPAALWRARQGPAWPGDRRTTTAGPPWHRAFTPEALRYADPARLFASITPDEAWGGATGRGVRVAVVDSGIEAD